MATFLNLASLNKYLKTHRGIRYIVEECGGRIHGESVFTVANSKSYAASLANQAMDDAYRHQAPRQTLFANSIRVTDPGGVVLAEIKRNGEIEYNTDAQPDAAYFVKVLKTARDEFRKMFATN